MYLKPVLSSEDKATFRAILEGAAAAPDLGVIANRYPWHSKMAIEKLLDFAKLHKLPIRIISGGGPEGFYDESIAKQFRDCKQAGCKPIQILVWQKDTNEISPALLSLANANVIDLRISGTDDYADKITHFLLVGDKAFRQEAAHPRFGKHTVFSDNEPQLPARIDFSDPEAGKSLLSTFSQLWGK
jgi:hypothetical protein